MTDEGKAEEYKRSYPIIELCVKLSLMNNVMDEGYHFLLNKIKQAYLMDLQKEEKKVMSKAMKIADTMHTIITNRNGTT